MPDKGEPAVGFVPRPRGAVDTSDWRACDWVEHGRRDGRCEGVFATLAAVVALLAVFGLGAWLF